MTGMNWDNLASLVTVTVALGSVAAWSTGRNAALSWYSFLRVFIYITILTSVVRFLDYALFDGILLSINHYVKDFCILMFIAFISYRLSRAKQMIKQYPWLYRRSVFFYMLNNKQIEHID